MRGYVIEGEYAGRRYFYPQFNGRAVDVTDISYAKVFPDIKSVKQNLPKGVQKPIVYEVEVTVKNLGKVEL